MPSGKCLKKMTGNSEKTYEAKNNSEIFGRKIERIGTMSVPSGAAAEETLKLDRACVGGFVLRR